MTPTFQTVGLVGTGAMGRGIAQMAAQAGSRVLLFDLQPGASQKAREALADTWQKLVDKGKLDDARRTELVERTVCVDALSSLAPCDLVVEAIVERLDVKQQLFADLESIVGEDSVLATNTSSLSVTAIGAALRRPGRLAGFHFFNPVPLMRVVEVIAGLKTDTVVCQQLTAFARVFGHTPVSAQDTPGFIVNHAGRGYGTEALRVAEERVADFATIDRILKDQMGFRLGPFELMDLTALDVSHPVMESIYRQYYDEPRYRPSVITAQRLAGGVVGKKVGEGFYSYMDGAAQVPAEPPVPAVATLPPVWVSPKAARRADIYKLLKDLGASIETAQTPSAAALILVAPLGLDVTTLAAVERLDPTRTMGIDMMLDDAATKRRVLCHQPGHPPGHARRRTRPVCQGRQSRERGPGQRWLRDAAGGGHHRQHRGPTCASKASAHPRTWKWRSRWDWATDGATGHGRPHRPDQRAGDPVQHGHGVWRSALPPFALAAPSRRPRAEPDA